MEKKETKLNELFLIVGTLGVGKTTITLELAKATGKKIIVLDDVVHKAYSDFETITTEGLPQLKGNCVVMMEDFDLTLEALANTQRNACVIVEDAGRYVSSNISMSVKRFIINHRKFNFDVFFMFHYLNEVPPYICKQYSKMLLFKTGDNLVKEQNKWSNWETIKKKAAIVKKHKSFNHFEIITKYD